MNTNLLGTLTGGGGPPVNNMGGMNPPYLAVSTIRKQSLHMRRQINSDTPLYDFFSTFNVLFILNLFAVFVVFYLEYIQV